MALCSTDVQIYIEHFEQNFVMYITEIFVFCDHLFSLRTGEEEKT